MANPLPAASYEEKWAAFVQRTELFMSTVPKPPPSPYPPPAWLAALDEPSYAPTRRLWRPTGQALSCPLSRARVPRLVRVLPMTLHVCPTSLLFTLLVLLCRFFCRESCATFYPQVRLVVVCWLFPLDCAFISTLGLASSFFSLPFLPGPKNITTAGFWEVQKSLGRGRLKGTKNGNCTWVLGKRPEKCIRVPGHKNGN